MGHTEAGNVTLTGGDRVEYQNNLYYDNKRFTYVVNGSTLTISNSTGSFNISNFSSGDLGIHLKIGDDDAPDPVYGDEEPYEYIYGRTNENDVLVGDGGNNIILGRGGNDYIIGGAGNDVIMNFDKYKLLKKVA